MSGPGTGWNGHLPSNRLEREILNAIDGFEDDDGNKSTFLIPDAGPSDTVFRPQQANTGVKGCRADARQHAILQQLQRQADAVRQKELLRRQANATVKPVGDSDDDDEVEEEEEFKKYKMERLREMQRHAATSAQAPRFGAVETISVDEYVAAVDCADLLDQPGSNQTYVVVHLQEAHVASCVRLHHRLEELAKKYDQVRFLSIEASEAKRDMDEAELPALVVYHNNGEFKASEKRVGRDAGDAFTTDAAEQTLLRLGVRLSSACAMRAADAAALSRLQQMGLSGGREPEDGVDEDEDAEEEAEEEQQQQGRRGARRARAGRFLGSVG